MIFGKPRKGPSFAYLVVRYSNKNHINVIVSAWDTSDVAMSQCDRLNKRMKYADDMRGVFYVVEMIEIGHEPITFEEAFE